ncbi:Tn7 transposase TnsA N-terminal domain-containing protein [Rhizobium giardinii]|uniref:Tn7 transposase TnsA N-terminal domain-containing protein n=1 Tax=Rhizobium giardinii TaxID=56731 RepID=UPI003D6EDDC6
MNYKNVLDFMKELAFGIDRREFCDREAVTELPDSFDDETRTLEEDDDGNIVEIDTWIPPARSTATRMPPARTKGHSRGALVDPRTYRSVTFASTHEMCCAMILIASPHIAEVYDQPPAIEYTDAAGKKRKHTPDYLAVDHAGRKCAIAVKPSRLVEKSGIKNTLASIRPVLGDYAEDIILLTEHQLTPGHANNAESAIHAQQCRIQEHCDRVLEIVHDAEGELNAYHVAGLFGDFALGMNAIWCLVYDGILELADPKRMLSDYPFVIVSPLRGVNRSVAA